MYYWYSFKQANPTEDLNDRNLSTWSCHKADPLPLWLWRCPTWACHMAVSLALWLWRSYLSYIRMSMADSMSVWLWSWYLSYLIMPYGWFTACMVVALISLVPEHAIWLMLLPVSCWMVLALMSLLPEHAIWLMLLLLYGLAMKSLLPEQAIWLIHCLYVCACDISPTKACHMADAPLPVWISDDISHTWACYKANSLPV